MKKVILFLLFCSSLFDNYNDYGQIKSDYLIKTLRENIDYQSHGVNWIDLIKTENVLLVIGKYPDKIISEDILKFKLYERNWLLESICKNENLNNILIDNDYNFIYLTPKNDYILKIDITYNNCKYLDYNEIKRIENKYIKRLD